MSSRSTIVLVHGSWVDPSFYSGLISHLKGLGYSVFCPLLPTCSPTATAETDLIDDAAAIRGLLTRLVEYERRLVVLLMHSYGGLVGSEAVPTELTQASRHKGGLAGGIIHLIYMAAFALPVGQSCEGFYGDTSKQIIKDSFYNDVDPRGRLFAEMTDEEASAWIAKLRPHPLKVQRTTSTRAAYDSTPSTYIIFTQDQAVPPSVQRQLASITGSKAVVELGVGHMAPLTRPTELGDTIERALLYIT